MNTQQINAELLGVSTKEVMRRCPKEWSAFNAALHRSNTDLEGYAELVGLAEQGEKPIATAQALTNLEKAFQRVTGYGLRLQSNVHHDHQLPTGAYWMVYKAEKVAE